MIKFHTEETMKNLTFNDVELNQFFVSITGQLYQKESDELANLIASEDGAPLACGSVAFEQDEEIRRILPRVTKIEF